MVDGLPGIQEEPERRPGGDRMERDALQVTPSIYIKLPLVLRICSLALPGFPGNTSISYIRTAGAASRGPAYRAFNPLTRLRTALDILIGIAYQSEGGGGANRLWAGRLPDLTSGVYLIRPTPDLRPSFFQYGQVRPTTHAQPMEHDPPQTSARPSA